MCISQGLPDGAKLCLQSTELLAWRLLLKFYHMKCPMGDLYELKKNKKAKPQFLSAMALKQDHVVGLRMLALSWRSKFVLSPPE
jgi:hypothetical protein